MGLTAWLALHAGVSVVMTWLALVYARRRNKVDLPGERRSHAIPTPRGGGIGVAVALLAGCLAGLATEAGPVPGMASFAGGLLLVAGVGWIDDHRPLSPWLRLGAQCLAGGLLAWGLHGAEGRWEWALLTAALVPVLVNVWNFMDGIDGLAATQAMLAAAAFAWLAPGTGWMALAFGVSVAGFLPFNFPRARIFLGDVGSGTLGYALAALATTAAPERGWGTAAVLLLPLSAFLVDASLTLAKRILAGEQWWQPHTSHLYQTWVKAGRSHAFVTFVYAAFCVAAIIVAFSIGQASPPVALGGTVLWLAGAVFGWLRIHRSLSSGKRTEEVA
jgi:UDP-N-acetylmuramyl pentapeptide phosphotransferase/UDP-N-acetylglucosamine-1-phosphate transferase